MNRDEGERQERTGAGFLRLLKSIENAGWVRRNPFVRDLVESFTEVTETSLDVYDQVARIVRSLRPQTEEQKQQREKEFAAANLLATAEVARLPVEHQLRIMNMYRDSPAVLAGAASQRNVPLRVQKQLVELARDNEDVMLLLAANTNTAMPVLASLTESSSMFVRQQTARMLARQMPIVSPDKAWTDARGRAFVAMLAHYDPSFGRDVVPVLDDPATIENLYFIHVNDYRNMARNAFAFANNPNTPDTVLTNISMNELLQDTGVLEVEEARDLAAIRLRNKDLIREHDTDDPSP